MRAIYFTFVLCYTAIIVHCVFVGNETRTDFSEDEDVPESEVTEDLGLPEKVAKLVILNGADKKAKIAALTVSSNPNDVRFFYYGNPADEDDRHEIMLNDPLSLVNAGYVYQRPLILLTHGVLSCSLTISDIQQVKNAYLRENVNANIVMVDYGELTMSRLPFILSPLSFIPFLMGHGNTDIVADRVMLFVEEFLLATTFLRSPQDMHLVGFSLGAHISGKVGRMLHQKTGIKVKRITGLDPSPQYPGYATLRPSDAEFVDVSLTSLGYLTTFSRKGQVQFYINGGGPHQPYCPNFAPVTETYCSHTTAVFYFAKSVRRKNIVACRCGFTCKYEPSNCFENTTYGQHTPPSTHGDYYVTLS